MLMAHHNWVKIDSKSKQEFTEADNVELYILTKKFMAGSNFSGDMYQYAQYKLGMDTEQKRQRGPTM